MLLFFAALRYLWRMLIFGQMMCICIIPYFLQKVIGFREILWKNAENTYGGCCPPILPQRCTESGRRPGGSAGQKQIRRSEQRIPLSCLPSQPFLLIFTYPSPPPVKFHRKSARRPAEFLHGQGQIMKSYILKNRAKCATIMNMKMPTDPMETPDK